VEQNLHFYHIGAGGVVRIGMLVERLNVGYLWVVCVSAERTNEGKTLQAVACVVGQGFFF